MEVNIKFTVFKQQNIYSVDVEGSNVVSLYLKHYLPKIENENLWEYELRTINRDFLIFDIRSIEIFIKILNVMRFDANQIADVKNMLDSKYLYDRYSTVIKYS